MRAPVLVRHNRTKPRNPALDHAHPLAAGLRGFWLFHEGAGARVFDLSPYNAIGTISSTNPQTAAAGWQPGPPGGLTGVALDHDPLGTGANLVQVAHYGGLDALALPNVGDAYTVEIWVWIDAVGNLDFFTRSSHIAWRMGGPFGSRHWALVGPQFGGGAAYDSGYAPPVGTWQNLAVVVRRTAANNVNVTFYANGRQTASVNGNPSLAANTNTLNFGIGNHRVSLVRFWGRGLTASEVLALHERPLDMLIPQRVWWAQPPPENTLLHQSLGTLRAFGSHQIFNGSVLIVPSIPTQRAFGTHKLVPRLFHSALGTLRAFGDHRIKLYALLHISLGTQRAFGTHTILNEGDAVTNVLPLPQTALPCFPQLYVPACPQRVEVVFGLGSRSTPGFGNHSIGNV